MSGRVGRHRLAGFLLLLALLATSFEIVHAQDMGDEAPYEEGIYYEEAPPPLEARRSAAKERH